MKESVSASANEVLSVGDKQVGGARVRPRNVHSLVGSPVELSGASESPPTHQSSGIPVCDQGRRTDGAKR